MLGDLNIFFFFLVERNANLVRMLAFCEYGGHLSKIHPPHYLNLKKKNPCFIDRNIWIHAHLEFKAQSIYVCKSYKIQNLSKIVLLYPPTPRCHLVSFLVPFPIPVIYVQIPSFLLTRYLRGPQLLVSLEEEE